MKLNYAFSLTLISLGMWVSIHPAFADTHESYTLIPADNVIASDSRNICEVEVINQPASRNTSAEKGIKIISGGSLWDYLELDEDTGQLWCAERDTAIEGYGVGNEYKVDWKLVDHDKKNKISTYSFSCGNFFTRTAMKGEFAVDDQSGYIIAYASRYWQSNNHPLEFNYGLGVTDVPVLGGWSPVKEELDPIVCDSKYKNVSHDIGLGGPPPKRVRSPFDKISMATSKQQKNLPASEQTQKVADSPAPSALQAD